MSTSAYGNQRHINDNYDVVGFISSGTYGRVYKAKSKGGRTAPPVLNQTTGRIIEAFAIKKFKPDKDGELSYTGISQSAIREMALCTELSHDNVISLVEIILESKCIFMVFEYAEHDLLQIIHWHTQHPRTPIPAPTLRSIMFQVLDGLLYLHRNWVMHRDLKPANIMVTSSGSVKIGDLGLARLFYKPLQTLFGGDKVVVTIWYRAPELLLGSRHYTPAIDTWAVGCIFAELMSLRPIFKGEEAKQDSKKTVPFQRNQMGKIAEVLGVPRKENWPLLSVMPEYPQLSTLAAGNPAVSRPTGLDKWWEQVIRNSHYSTANLHPPHRDGLDMLKKLLEYDPLKRLSAEQALQHPYFAHDEVGNPAAPPKNCFEGIENRYPPRKVSSEDNDIRTGSLPGTKRNGLPDDLALSRPAKRLKEG
ncbi:serine/threonine protein kinase, CMGC family, CDC2/CDK subfamily [Delphinella strobiligena]|nr:serine/threonine protein kinase, CMGC family, CDC2/CDK subfamily [Delphinella strobiligena]